MPSARATCLQIATKVEGNPIMQDEKKGKARLYHGPIFWNYGCLPQTWEDPNVKGDADVGGAFGDDDPVDVRCRATPRDARLGRIRPLPPRCTPLGDWSMRLLLSSKLNLDWRSF